MRNDEAPSKVAIFTANFMLNFFCSVVAFPFIGSIIYQDVGFFVIMLLLFIITIPTALVVGGVLMLILRTHLTSPYVWHFKNRKVEGLIAGGVFGLILGLILSLFHIKFAVAVALTGSVMGLLLITTSDISIEQKKEKL